MTAGLRALWISVCAASWHQSTARVAPGPVTDGERALWCIAQADRAVHAIMASDAGLSDYAAEVLG